MKFLTNENVPISSINYLKSKGYDITSIGVDEPGISDELVMNISIKEYRTIITYDSDYGELIFKHGYKPGAGVIFIRQQPSDPLETAKIIEKITSNLELVFEQTLTVVDKNSIKTEKILTLSNISREVESAVTKEIL